VTDAGRDAVPQPAKNRPAAMIGAIRTARVEACSIRGLLAWS
jgi:hypothetical protein